MYIKCYYIQVICILRKIITCLKLSIFIIIVLKIRTMQDIYHCLVDLIIVVLKIRILQGIFHSLVGQVTLLTALAWTHI